LKISKVAYKYPPYPRPANAAPPVNAWWISGEGGEETESYRVVDEESWKRACAKLRLRECSVKVRRTRECEEQAKAWKETVEVVVVGAAGLKPVVVGVPKSSAGTSTIDGTPAVRKSTAIASAIPAANLPNFSSPLSYLLPSGGRAPKPAVFQPTIPTVVQSFTYFPPRMPIANGLAPPPHAGGNPRKTAATRHQLPVPMAMGPPAKRPRVFVYEATKYGAPVRKSSVALFDVLYGFPPEFKRKFESQKGSVRLTQHRLTPDGSFSDGRYVGYTGNHRGALLRRKKVH
jgi:hypothetical protein